MNTATPPPSLFTEMAALLIYEVLKSKKLIILNVFTKGPV